MKTEWTNKDSLSIESTGQKAVLVIDMPHCCQDCICADWDQCLCKASNREIYSQEYMNGGRQRWCPLKPMPNKKEIQNENGYYDLSQLLYEGWNACLEKITGETE